MELKGSFLQWPADRPVLSRAIALALGALFTAGFAPLGLSLIVMGRKLPELPATDRTDANRIKGCQSQVWMVAEAFGDRLRFRAISDAAIVSGLIALLLRIYSDRKPEDILGTPPDFVQALGLESHLSPTRSNGLASMLTAIRGFAQDQLEAA